MAKEYAISFYNSRQWKDCRKGYMQSKNFICERCGKLAYICHHKKHITESNINNPNITLNWDNLQALCLDCHNIIHGRAVTRKGLKFDSYGNLIKETKLKQEIKVILGYPGSGKTTYVKDNMSAYDMVIDLDRIIEALTFKEGHNREYNSFNAVRVGNDIIKGIISQVKSYEYDTLYIIRTKLSDDEMNKLKRADAKFYWIDEKEEVCKQRLIEQNRQNTIKAMDKCKEFYEKYLIDSQLVTPISNKKSLKVDIGATP